LSGLLKANEYDGLVTEIMHDTAIPKKMLYGKLYATRRRGRPKTRLLDDVSADLRKMGINKWRGRARD
jgi:hypothetical protein